MKVISMPAPLAVLTAYGYRTIHTTPLDTEHRGWVAIHAARSIEQPYADMIDEEDGTFPFPDALRGVNKLRSKRGWETWPLPNANQGFASGLPAGAIVGVAWLAKVESAMKAYTHWSRLEDVSYLMHPDYNEVPCWEPSFGMFRRGNMAWWLHQIMALANPVTVEGFNGPWDTKDAWLRDRPDDSVIVTDGYEALIAKDIGDQGLTLPAEFDPAFWRGINRRGETDATRPKNL